MTQLWHDLPNAALIDRILADLRARPEAWRAARTAARTAAGQAAWSAARAAARDAAGQAARDAAWEAARPAAWAAAWAAAWGAILALIAWDDCAHLLDTDPEQVQLLALLGHQRAMLLYPACVALSKNTAESMTYAA